MKFVSYFFVVLLGIVSALVFNDELNDEEVSRPLITNKINPWKNSNKELGKIMAATAGQFPYRATIIMPDYVCGGSILSPWYILTSAFCAKHGVTEHIFVRVDSLHPNEGGQLIPIQEVISHASFNMETMKDDICVMKLKYPMRLTSGTALVTLPQRGEEPGHIGTLTLFGFDEYAASKTLEYSELPIIRGEECKKLHEIPNRTFCGCAASFENNEGDFGGPLVIGDSSLSHLYVQVGILKSMRIPFTDHSECKGGVLEVYTKVSDYASWISFAMED